MLDAKARPMGALRTIVGWSLVCLSLSASPVLAQTPEARTPIVYAATAPAPQSSGAMLASRDIPVLPRPVVPSPSVAPGAFNDRIAAPPIPVPSTQALDIRPGALKNSFGPTPATLSRSTLNTASVPLARPLTPSSALAQPYVGAPYQVAGKWFVPMHEPNYDEVGIASWYGPNFHGKAAATGEIYDQMAMTAAHPTLPIPSLVRVTNLENGKSVVVRINDRGPFVDDRLIDLSKAAALALDMTGKGTAKVRVQYVGAAPAAANTLPAGEPAGQASTAAPVAYTPAAPAAGAMYLQVGAFADLSNAYAQRDRLAAMGRVSIVEGKSGGQRLYRVMVGPLSNREEAERTQDKLANAGLKALIVAR